MSGKRMINRRGAVNSNDLLPQEELCDKFSPGAADPTTGRDVRVAALRGSIKLACQAEREEEETTCWRARPKEQYLREGSSLQQDVPLV